MRSKAEVDEIIRLKGAGEGEMVREAARRKVEKKKRKKNKKKRDNEIRDPQPPPIPPMPKGYKKTSIKDLEKKHKEVKKNNQTTRKRVR